ncbi:MAG TPA: O-antigen ligase family protein [Pyrinomonadaceae bacterium]|nr:O-antigen ligase family protein [Pyrinomonadaceae bacterium]
MEARHRSRFFRDESGDLPRSEERGKLPALVEAFVFYSLIILVALVAVPYGTVEPWWEAVFECAAFFLGLLWIIHGLLVGSWVTGNARVFYPMMALVVLAIVQSLLLWQTDWAGNKVWYAISADPFESRRFVLKTAALILSGVMLIRFTASRRRLSVLVHAIIGVALATALFGIARQAMQHAPGFVLPLLRPGVGYAQFINKNHFAYLMEMAMGLVAGVAIMRSEGRERILVYLSALLLMWAALVLSHSRGGLFAMVAQVVCAPAIFLNSGTRAADGAQSWTRSVAVRTAMIVALLLVVAGGVVWLGGDHLATGAETASIEIAGADRSELHEGARRRDAWRASWLMFKAHPIAGAGFGGYWAEVPVFHQASGRLTPQQAHNDYLEVLASGGLVGVGLFVWFAIVLVNQARKTLKATDGFQRAVACGATIALVGVAVHSIVDFGLHITVNALVFVALLAILSLSALAPTKRPSEGAG